MEPGGGGRWRIYVYIHARKGHVLSRWPAPLYAFSPSLLLLLLLAGVAAATTTIAVAFSSPSLSSAEAHADARRM